MHPVVVFLLPVAALALLLFAATVIAALHPDEPEPRRPAPKKCPPTKKPAKAAPAAAPKAAEPAPVGKPAFVGNNAFAGESVAFTGRLEGMTREEAIRAVVANGGRAFDSMPAGTTILVVGDKPGTGKLDKADRWTGQLRKITQREFMAMLNRPLTLSPEAFAETFARK